MGVGVGGGMGIICSTENTEELFKRIQYKLIRTAFLTKATTDEVKVFCVLSIKIYKILI
jgi:hypothetical protein